MSPHATLPLSPRPPAALGVLALHVVLVLMVLQADLLDQVLPQVAPVHVTLLATPERRPAPPPAALPLPAPARPTAPAVPWLSAPQVDLRPAPALPAATPAPEPARAVDVAPAPAALAVQPSPAAPAPAPPAEPRQVPAGAISYRVPPAIAMPLASRRLREGGTVWLRVRVDRQGMPAQVSVQMTSGFPRLDEQALAAMQVARFVPRTENGMPVEWVVIAPLAYDID